jgi:hypothetical protein
MQWGKRAWSGYRFLRTLDRNWEQLLKDFRGIVIRHTWRVVQRRLLRFWPRRHG